MTAGRRVGRPGAMRFAWRLAWRLGLGLCPLANAEAAVESQARGMVEALPAHVAQVFRCGTWAEAGRRGHVRIVLATVSGGAGTEVYVQRVAERLERAELVFSVVSTVPVRELNNDHAQYLVEAARCVGRHTVELVAAYEHDEGDVHRRIRLRLTPDGGYRLAGNTVVPPSKKRR